MTGSTRLISTPASSVRAPYSAPQTSAHSPASPPLTTAGSHRQPTRNFDPETGASLRLPAPFVPREFRATVRSDVTMVPTAERVQGGKAFAIEASVVAASISELFTEDAVPAAGFASFVESHGLDESEIGGSAELPWIDAFAADAAEPEETWPLDDAGKRLDELTQSLSSLDASRGRIEAERLSAGETDPEAPVQMWNEEEWIDIMPTSPADITPPDELRRGVTHNDGSAKHEAFANGSPGIAVNAESAACALEGLAQRVRAGQVHVPVFPAELGQEAMLAGLLASMLGWRQ